MVVWVFAGGGDSERKALVPFLEDHFDTFSFERKSPARIKPGPKPGKQRARHAPGKTGRGLAKLIEHELPIALRNGRPDMILVIDDLDCNNPFEREKIFIDAIDKVAGDKNIEKQVGFAAPEIESWLIADWGNTFEKDLDFRNRHKDMRWWLSTTKELPFGNPETFSQLDPAKEACKEKLSELIIEASQRMVNTIPFSKGIHTPRMLMNIDPSTVCKKCPQFQRFFKSLESFSNKSK